MHCGSVRGQCEERMNILVVGMGTVMERLMRQNTVRVETGRHPGIIRFEYRFLSALLFPDFRRFS